MRIVVHALNIYQNVVHHLVQLTITLNNILLKNFETDLEKYL